MVTHTSSYRIGYAETDQMGYMHHSNYIKYYERARWELFRSMGISYKSLEESGYMLPVVDLQCKYLIPAFYDDEIKIETTLIKMKGPRLYFTYTIYNLKKQAINTAETTVAFIHKESRKPCAPPDLFMQQIVKLSIN